MTRTPNTLDAHRLIWFAGKNGVQDAAMEAVFAAYFVEGHDIGQHAVLAGAPPRPDWTQAEVPASWRPTGSTRKCGPPTWRPGKPASGVPSFFLDGYSLFSGAKPAEKSPKRCAGGGGFSSSGRRSLVGQAGEPQSIDELVAEGAFGARSRGGAIPISVTRGSTSSNRRAVARASSIWFKPDEAEDQAPQRGRPRQVVIKGAASNPSASSLLPAARLTIPTPDHTCTLSGASGLSRIARWKHWRPRAGCPR